MPWQALRSAPAWSWPVPSSWMKQRYTVAGVDDQVEVDLPLLLDEFDVFTGQLQGERARDRAVSGLQRHEQAVPDDEGGDLDVKDDRQLEPEGVHLDPV